MLSTSIRRYRNKWKEWKWFALNDSEFSSKKKLPQQNYNFPFFSWTSPVPGRTAIQTIKKREEKRIFPSCKYNEWCELDHLKYLSGLLINFRDKSSKKRCRCSVCSGMHHRICYVAWWHFIMYSTNETR